MVTTRTSDCTEVTGVPEMVVKQPHYLLFTNAHLSKSRACAINDQGFGRWHFVLERLDGPERLEAADAETDVHRDRLALLAVVRGLEALEQPSNVTLVTTSRYVSRGLRYGLNEWRDAEYTWEHFGMQKPIRNADLWQRIDGAMRFHQITCRLLQSPLAQAMVETATELDELNMFAHPLDTTLDVAEGRASENQTAAALVRRETAAGVIQRVDSAHSSMGPNVSQHSALHPSTLQPNALQLANAIDVQHAGESDRVAMTTANIAAMGGSTEIHSESQSISHRSMAGRLITELQGSELQNVRRRPRITVTLPNWKFGWAQWILQYLRNWRLAWARGTLRDRLLAMFLRSTRNQHGAAIAPT